MWSDRSFSRKRVYATAFIVQFAVTIALLPSYAADKPGPSVAVATISRTPGDTTPATPDAARALVFSAAPRESAMAAEEMYRPVAQYLSRAIGRTIIYRYPGTWGAYRADMLNGRYDIVFDGPHFNGYRVERLQHNILAKMSSALDFAIVVRADSRFKDMGELSGRTFCSHPPPNLGALVLLSRFNNPSRQPAIIVAEGWKQIYDGVVSGQCVGGVLPLANLQQFDKDATLRVVYQTQSLPNQAFSAAPSVSLEEQRKLAEALTAPEALDPLKRMRAAFRIDRLVVAKNAEYAVAAELLRGEWGY